MNTHNKRIFALAYLFIGMALLAYANGALGQELHVDLVQPNGNQYLSGTGDILFTWHDLDENNFEPILADIYFSNDPGDFDNEIVLDLDLLSGFCQDTDGNLATDQFCTFTWDTENEDDGNYFIDIEIRSDGNSVEDSSKDSFQIDNTDPSRPGGLEKEEVSSSRVHLIWSESSDHGSGVLGYNVYRDTRQFDEGDLDRTFSVFVDTASFIDNTVEDGIDYFYRVEAMDRAGNRSELSNDRMVEVPDANEAREERNVLIEPELETIFIESDDTVKATFSVRNQLNERLCMNFSGQDDSQDLTTQVSRGTECLNSDERTFITLTITSDDLPRGTYLVDFRVDDEKGERNTGHLLVRREFGENIEFIAQTKNICIGDTGIVDVLIRNNDTRPHDIELRASSDEFLPAFSSALLEMDSLDRVHADLEIFVPHDTRENRTFGVDVFAIGKDFLVKDRVFFRTRDCGIEEEKATFTLQSADNACPAVEKGDAVDLSVRLRNLENETQVVQLAVISALEAEIADEVVLPARGSNVVDFTLNATRLSGMGEQAVEVFAWNTDHRERIELCVDVEGLHEAQAKILTNDLVLGQGMEGAFEVKVENTGDFVETFTARVSALSNAQVELSDETFTVAPGTTHTVKVTVRPDNAAPFGEYSFDLLLEGPVTELFVLRYTVVDTRPPEVAVVLTSYPATLQVTQGTSEFVTIKITNFGDVDILDVRVTMQGLPNGISFQERGLDLRRGQTGTILEEMRVSDTAEPGTHHATLSMAAGITQQNVPVTITVNERGNGGDGGNGLDGGGFLSGLFLFGGPILAGVVLLLLIIGLIAMFATPSNDGRPTWFRN